MTLPIILAYARADDADQRFLEARDRDRQPDRKPISTAPSPWSSRPARSRKPWRRARAYADVAKAALASLPDSEIKQRAGGHRRFLRRTRLLEGRRSGGPISWPASSCDDADLRHEGRRDPPVRLQPACSKSSPPRCAAIVIGKERKTGRAAARHAREQRARQRRQRGQHLADHRLQARAGASRSLRVASRKRSRSASVAEASARQRHLRRRCGLSSAANTSLVGTATPGLTSSMRHARHGRPRRAGFRRGLP